MHKKEGKHTSNNELNDTLPISILTSVFTITYETQKEYGQEGKMWRGSLLDSIKW